MNEKIKELIEECTRVENGVMQVRRNETVYHFDKVKFAELIVRECISMADDFECDVNQRGLVDRMKQHFGVEE